MAAIAIAVLATACGGSDSLAENTLESADGLASLSLAPESLPEGVALDDVRVDVLVDETAEPGAPVLALQLLPDGLELDEPARLTIDLPEALEGGFLAIHMSGDSIEFLDGDIQDADGVLSFETSVDHFSAVTMHSSERFDPSVSAAPEQVVEGEVQSATATITARSDPVVIWLSFGSDPAGTFRQFRLSPPQPPIAPSAASIIWRGGTESGAASWDPSWRQLVEITKTPSGWETSTASATCLTANTGSILLQAGFRFNTALLDRGEPVSKPFLEFSRSLVSAESPQGRVYQGKVSLLEMSPGDTMVNFDHFWARMDSVCIGTGGGSGDDSGTDETDPGDTGAVDAGAGDGLTMENMLPIERELTTAGLLGDFAGGGADAGRAETALGEVRIILAPSRIGGKLVLSAGPGSEAPTGDFLPDGRGGFVFDDSAKLDSGIADVDEITDIGFADGGLTFTWNRTNHDGSTWTATVSVPVPPETERWFTGLPASGEADCTATFSGDLSEDNSLMITGETDAPDGTVFEVMLSDGQRMKVEVFDGAFEAEFSGVGRNQSNKVVVDVLKGSHSLDGKQISEHG